MRPWRGVLAAGAAVVTLAATDQKETEAAPMNEPVAINLSRDVGWSGSEMMELARDAASSLDLSFNYDGHPEIGVWKATLPRERFAAAWAALRTSGYETLPGPSTIAPGTKQLFLGVRGPKEAAPQMRGFPMKPPPPELVPVLATLDAAIGELRKHPLRVLRGQAALVSPRVERGHEAVLSLRLTNAGTEPLTMGNPLVGDPGAPGAWSGIRLVLVDVRGRQEQQQINVTPADLHSSSARTPTVTLAPGASLDLEIRRKIDVASGTHQVRVEYHNLIGESAEPRVVRGTLWLDAGQIKIDRPWWKFWG